MSRSHRLRSGRRYEELLDDLRSDDSDLSALLGAARAPGTRDEMAGLPGISNAFMSVPYVRTRPVATISKLPAATRTAAGRLFVLKVLAAVSGATLVGGAAYATTGASFLGGSSPAPKHTTSVVPHAPGHRNGGYPVPAGGVLPTPGVGQPHPAPVTHAGGSLNGRSSAARTEHSPSKPATPPGRTNPSGPPTTRSPQPHPTPTAHDTNPPHTPSPGPHNTATHAAAKTRPTEPAPSSGDRP